MAQQTIDWRTGSFGTLLRGYRGIRCLTQEELAERSGLSVNAISMLERGVRRAPRSTTIAFLADALRLDASQRTALAAAARGHEQQPPTHRLSSAVPRELPHPSPDFTGRALEQAELRAPMTMSTVHGMGGIGKSALAIHVAHQLADEFPDGQLYLNLHGLTAGLAPLEPHDALARLMRSLGLPADAIPTGVEEASSRFRSMAAGRRLLIVLDDAHSADQVRPLIPGSPTCKVLVTSRQVLSTLEGAQALHLDVLSEDEALHLLERILGRERVATDAQAAAEVVRSCGRLPLAIRIAAARLASRPTWPIREYAHRLVQATHGLQPLSAGELSVRATFEVSLQALENGQDPVDAAAAAAFRLCSIADGDDLGLDAASRLLGLSVREAQPLLERLVDVQLLEAPQPDRYRFHHLVRLYAREQVLRCHSECERLTALTRVMGFYTATAWCTLATLRPGDRRIATADPRWNVGGLEFTHAAAALRWLEVERTNLLAAVIQAAELVRVGSVFIAPELPGQLARAMFCLLTAGHLHDLLRANEAALLVARHIDDRPSQACAHNDLGVVYESLGMSSEAITCLEESLRLCRELGDRYGQAGTSTNLGLVYERLGRCAEAIARHRESLMIFRELRDERGQATSLDNLGVAYARIGRSEEAIACLQDALTIFRQLDARLGYACTLQDLGLVYCRQERFADAVVCQRESLVFFGELEFRPSQAHGLMGLGVALTRLQRHEEAIDCLWQSLAIFREVGLRRYEALVLLHLGVALNAAGSEEQARAVWENALTEMDKLQLPEAEEVRARLDAT